jgi:hypothetical protein
MRGGGERKPEGEEGAPKDSHGLLTSYNNFLIKSSSDSTDHRYRLAAPKDQNWDLFPYGSRSSYIFLSPMHGGFSS